MSEKKKQASIAAFFSPRTAKKQAAAVTTPPVQPDEVPTTAKTSGNKRPRATRTPTATPPAAVATPVDGGSEESVAKSSGPSSKRPAAKRPRAAARQPPPQPQQQKKQPKKREPKKRAKGKVLFTSPHEFGGDDDVDEDMDDAIELTPAASPERAAVNSTSAPVAADNDTPAITSEGAVDASNGAGDGHVDETDPVEATEEDVVMVEVDDDGTPTSQIAGHDDQAIDLTTSPNDAEEISADTPQTQKDAATNGSVEKKRRGRSKRAVSAAPTPAKSAKKQAKAATDASRKDAAANPAPEVKVVLDPAVQARVDTYQQKLQALTQQCTDLLNAKGDAGADDLLQDIYGVGLDVELDVSSSTEQIDAALTSTWGMWLDEVRQGGSAHAPTADLSHDMKAFVAKHIQGKSASLSSLCADLLARSQPSLQAAVDKSDVSRTKDHALLRMEMEIKMLAQRTPYGVKPLKANLFEDTTPEALWVWEIGTIEQYYKDEALKLLKRVRKHRKRLGMQLKSLARVIHLLHQSPIDEARVSAEEAKVGKFVLAVEAEIQKTKDRDRKEQEKLQAAESKKRQDADRQQAKEDEKKKRDLEEQKLATKRKQSMVSYFRSIDITGVENTAEPSNAASTSVSASAPVTEQSIHNVVEVENTSETMDRMDDAIGFLHSSGVPPSGVLEISHQSGFPWLGRPKRNRAVHTSVQNWTSKRRRDPARGIMKLLQFHENYRPAFYGTFSTKSPIFHGGRRPLAQFSKFDYEVDSDDEWEEEEPGESLSGAESDNDESDDDNLDYGDNWLAYEDEVEYMDDGDMNSASQDETGNDDDDESMVTGGSPQKRKHKLPSQLEQKRRVRVAGNKKLSKLTKLEPKIVGPFVCQDASCADHIGVFRGELLRTPAFESTLMRKAREFDAAQLEKQQLEKLAEERRQQQQQQQQQALSDEAATGVKSKTNGGKATPVKARKSVTVGNGPTTEQTTKVKKTKGRKTTTGDDASTERTPKSKKVSAAATSAASTMTSPSQQPGIAGWLQPQAQSSAATSAIAKRKEERDQVVVDDSSDVEMVEVRPPPGRVD